MIESVRRLTSEDLTHISGGLRSGRLAPPYRAVSLQHYCARERAESVAQEMQRVHEEGLRPEHLAGLLEALVADRASRVTVMDAVDLVSTGPEAPGTANRDTSVVVRELFGTAEESVVVVGYAIYQGRQVFATLAKRMEECPDLRVQMFLDIQRPQTDTSAPSELVARFAKRFRDKEWPGERLPEVYYDPRSVELESAKKASLHAKCVVVDRERAFVSSANFTEAAQVRNIEVGVLIRSREFAAKLVSHFEKLAAAGELVRVEGV